MAAATAGSPADMDRSPIKHMDASRKTILRMTYMIGVMVVGMSSVCMAAEPKASAWSGGIGIGFLGNTPDGTAFATNFNADYLHVFSRDVLQRIGSGDEAWTQMVPEAVAELIKKRGFFGYAKPRE